MDLEQSHAEFQDTQWTLIEALHENDHPQHSEALAILLGRYWPPIYAYLRRRGNNPEEASELTQGFFADVVMQRGLFENADPTRGRLRSLLLKAVKRYLLDQARRRSARRCHTTVSLDQLEREETVLADDTAHDADQAFERRWAVAVLEEALQRCQQHFQRMGRERHWSAFEAHTLQPSVAMTARRPLSEIAQNVGFNSPGEAAGAVRTVRKRAMALLHEVVAETVADREEGDAEFQLVMSLLG